MLLRPEGYEYRGGAMDKLYDAMQREYPIEAMIVRVTWENNLPVWELDLGVVRGLVPSSETGLGNDAPALMQKFTGQKVSVKIKGIDKNAGIAACSRREAIADAREKMFDVLREGQRIEAVVKIINPKQLLVDIGGGVLVHVPRVAATKSRALRLVDIFSPGQPVSVIVKALNKQTDTISVTMVSGSDPWEEIPELRRGDSVAGIVVGLNPEYVMVETFATPGVVGLAPPPQRGNLRRGSKVRCVVQNFSRKNKKLSLRLRDTLA
ncbi:30S ribosomal protein S1 [Pelotomaculum schinkii]|uniref:30S ribosomal protein S1 n=1 Tax=Pelotomaculum schinkii TaxID=78350 RepID=A0A4Y7R7Y2_9FIRM|nr:30S ribosomal protein S1 [Pelotomaculum schinkii]TEB04751.1 30S ribosomal protein S1 [Pelotomaculum schinkii]